MVLTGLENSLLQDALKSETMRTILPSLTLLYYLKKDRKKVIYLDNAATTFPKPVSIYEMTFHFMKRAAGNPGRGGHEAAVNSAEMVERVRKKVAQMFHVPDPDHVIFTYNCTDSINIVLKGFVKSGQHVIATNLDHNSASRPLEGLAKKGVHVTRLPFSDSGKVYPADFRKSIQPNTSLLVLNHGSNVLGSVQELFDFVDLEIPVLLDAAQTAGRIPIAVEQKNLFVAFSAHKALFGMPGLGILIVPQNVKIDSWREGGSGTASERLEHPKELPMHLEAGTPNFLSIASLFYSIEFIEKEGMDRIHQKERELARKTVDFLRADDRFILYSSFLEEDLAVIAFNFRNVPPDEAAAILDQRFGIAVRAGLHCAAVLHQQLGTLPDGCIRVSPGYFNTEEEMLTLIQALSEIADAYR